MFIHNKNITMGQTISLEDLSIDALRQCGAGEVSEPLDKVLWTARISELEKYISILELTQEDRISINSELQFLGFKPRVNFSNIFTSEMVEEEPAELVKFAVSLVDRKGERGRDECTCDSYRGENHNQVIEKHVEAVSALIREGSDASPIYGLFLCKIREIAGEANKVAPDEENRKTHPEIKSSHVRDIVLCILNKITTANLTQESLAFFHDKFASIHRNTNPYRYGDLKKAEYFDQALRSEVELIHYTEMFNQLRAVLMDWFSHFYKYETPEKAYKDIKEQVAILKDMYGRSQDIHDAIVEKVAFSLKHDRDTTYLPIHPLQHISSARKAASVKGIISKFFEDAKLL